MFAIATTHVDFGCLLPPQTPTQPTGFQGWMRMSEHGMRVLTGAIVCFLSTKEHSRLCDKPPTCLPANWTAADHPPGKAGSVHLWNLRSLGSRPWLTPAAREPAHHACLFQTWCWPQGGGFSRHLISGEFPALQQLAWENGALKQLLKQEEQLPEAELKHLGRVWVLRLAWVLVLKTLMKDLLDGPDCQMLCIEQGSPS